MLGTLQARATRQVTGQGVSEAHDIAFGEFIIKSWSERSSCVALLALLEQ